MNKQYNSFKNNAAQLYIRDSLAIFRFPSVQSLLEKPVNIGIILWFSANFQSSSAVPNKKYNCAVLFLKEMYWLFFPNIFSEITTLKPYTKFTDLPANGRIYWTSCTVFVKALSWGNLWLGLGYTLSRTGVPPRREWDQRLGYPQKEHGTRVWGTPPGKDLGLESGEGTGKLTGVPPSSGVNRLKTLPYPILWMWVVKNYTKSSKTILAANFHWHTQSTIFTALSLSLSEYLSFYPRDLWPHFNCQFPPHKPLSGQSTRSICRHWYKELINFWSRGEGLINSFSCCAHWEIRLWSWSSCIENSN